MNEDRLEKLKAASVKYIGAALLGAAVLFALSPYLSQHMGQLGKEKIRDLKINTQDYGISETVRAVKAELYDAQQKMAENREAALFQAESFDLELNFVVRGSGSTTVESSVPQFFVVGETSKYSAERIQKIKLHFTVLPDEKRSGKVQRPPADIQNGRPQDLTPQIPPPQGE
ncbi:MAG: hypothetical protein L3J26_02745 [Candidatus Polarisedimenticolaceae bacterium]|nr:hypothetical protein [Candidatus Polarisedimenticolaceae bacterium]